MLDKYVYKKSQAAKLNQVDVRILQASVLEPVTLLA